MIDSTVIRLLDDISNIFKDITLIIIPFLLVKIIKLIPIIKDYIIKKSNMYNSIYMYISSAISDNNDIGTKKKQQHKNVIINFNKEGG